MDLILLLTFIVYLQSCTIGLMNSKRLIIIFFLILAGVGTWLVVVKGKEFTPAVSDDDEDETQLLKRINSVQTTTPDTPVPENTPALENTPAETSAVPLPTEEDIVRTFFELINEKKIPEAISMMSNSMVGDESSKQAWGVQFNALNSIKVSKIEPAMQERWGENSHEYKVTLDVKVSSDAANAPIPYYGWDNGSNIRWVEIVRENGLWMVNSLATGQ